MPEAPGVTASEVGAYASCKRCWWLEMHGLREGSQTPAMEAGTRYHNQLRARRHRVLWQRSAGLALVAFGVLLLVAVLAVHLL